MKKIVSILLLAAVSVVMSGCEKDLPLYDEPDNRLIFLFGREVTNPGFWPRSSEKDDYVLAYSFLYNDFETDDVYVEVKTIGFLSDVDRPVELVQVPSPVGEDAVPGVHYLPLTDAYYKDKFYIPAGKTSASLPIKVIRDPSLDNKEVILRLAIRETPDFKPGYETRRELPISITADVARPANWTVQVGADEFGMYGKVKHRFMITASGGQKIDEDYFTELGYAVGGGYINGKYDSGYSAFIVNTFREKLVEENARRAELGLGPLAEEDNTVVAFNRYTGS